MIRAAVSAAPDGLEELRARFVELAPEGFEETDAELAAYGDAAQRVLAAFPEARVTEVEEGWEDRWREFHHAVRVGQLWVGPPWEEPDADAVAVVIDPGRAFGTGAHPTTRLCLELLLEREPGSVLDVGCGSGVLAIAAAKLGHAPVTGVDVEEAAVEATRVNAERNGVAVEARLAGGALPPAELALANISLPAIESLRLDAHRVITSGYLAAEVPVLFGFTRTGRRERDGWAADVHERA